MWELLFERRPYYDSQSYHNIHLKVSKNPNFRPTITPLPEDGVPVFERKSKKDYIEIFKRCWAHRAEDRPKFDEVNEELQTLLQIYQRNLKNK